MNHDSGAGLHRPPGATDGPGPLTPLERAALDSILSGDDPVREALRAQAASATAASRMHSGVGFVTRLSVPEAAGRTEGDPVPPLRPARASHPELPEPAEFLLQVRDGRLAVLEAFCFEGGWPSGEEQFRMERA